MSKFNMKDYEDFMKEEERQDRLQRDLEYKRYEESYESEENWRDYQRKQEEERQWEAFNSYPEYDGYFDNDNFEDSYGLDSLSLDELISIFFEDLIEPRKIEKRKKANTVNADFDTISECISRKSTARKRHLNKGKAKNAKAQNAAYVAERELRKCSKQLRKLDREYLKLSYKLYSDTYFPYSKSQNITKQMNIILDHLRYLKDEEVYFCGILEMTEYKRALSSPKAV